MLLHLFEVVFMTRLLTLTFNIIMRCNQTLETPLLPIPKQQRAKEKKAVTKKERRSESGGILSSSATHETREFGEKGSDLGYKPFQGNRNVRKQIKTIGKRKNLQKERKISWKKFLQYLLQPIADHELIIL